MEAVLNPVYLETNANRAVFEVFCRSLSEEDLATPVPDAIWNVKDYIAHLASIDIWVGEWFEHQADGTPWRPTGEGGATFDIDVWNEAQILERRDASVEDLLLEAAAEREKLWSAVDRFSPEVLDAKFDFRGANITFLRYMQLWAMHDPAHSADILRALPAKNTEPMVRTWLAKYGM